MNKIEHLAGAGDYVWQDKIFVGIRFVQKGLHHLPTQT